LNLLSKFFRNFSINLIFLLWVLIFIWRKSFSYLNIGGLYIIEFLVIISLLSLFFAFLINKKLTLPPKNSILHRLINSVILFVTYSILNSIFHLNVNLKSLLPGVYPIYFVIVVIISFNVDINKLEFLTKLMFKFIFFSAFISFLVSPFGNYFLPETDNPGWTYIFGASLSAILILIENKLTSILLFLVTLIIAIITFQRGVFLCFLLSFPFLIYIEKKVFLIKLFSISKTFLFSLLLLLLISPIAFKILNTFNDLRFDISFHNLYLFINSIFSSSAADELGVAGTRSHRLDMWAEVLKLSYENLIFIFGDGFQQDVGDKIGIQFRAVHNGFVTIFFQDGIIGLILFLYFLFLLYKFYKNYFYINKENPNLILLIRMGIIIFAAMIGDALTGTILDSPFTSWLFYTQSAFLVSLIFRLTNK
jgi:hypothetical protein